jgi:hypothetical protein
MLARKGALARAEPLPGEVSIGDWRLLPVSEAASTVALARSNLPEALAIKRFLRGIRTAGLAELIARYWAQQGSEPDNWRAYLPDARQVKRCVEPAVYLSRKIGARSMPAAIEAALADV